MNTVHRDTPHTLWSTDLAQPPAGPPLPIADLLLAPTQERGPTAQHALLHALSLAAGGARWQHSFEYALVTGLAAVQTSEVSETSEVLALVALASTDLLRGAGALVALDAAGEERYRWAPGVQRVSAPAVSGGVACFTADARALVLLDPASGEERASVKLGTSASLSAPALADGVAYVPCRGPHLLAVGWDGKVRWRFDAPESGAVWLDKTPVVVGELVFAALTSGAVLALRVEDGALAWRADVGPAGKRLSPPVADGERVYVGARDGLHALDLGNGRAAWTFPTERRIVAAPVVAGGVVYAACHDHHLYALDAATGRESWRREVERRIEVAPVLAACGSPPTTCAIVADRGGALTAIACPLDAEELETRARSLEEADCSDEERAEAWAAAAQALADLGARERAAACQEKVARWLRQPVIRLDVQHEGLVLDAWTRLQFIARNEGYGPARNLIIRASGDQFQGQVMATQRIIRLEAKGESADWLDVRPREYGDSVPLRVSVEYQDLSGATCVCEQTIYISVAQTETGRGAGQTHHVRLPATTHVLSFDRLSPLDFERLCLWLVEGEGYVRGEHLGLAGSEQGRDVIAYKRAPDGEELWYFQCKRYKSIGAKTLRDEVDKYLALAEEKPHLRPAGVVFVVSCAASAQVREQVGDYCEQHGLEHEFWALTELDMRVKRYPDLLQEFFNLAL